MLLGVVVVVVITAAVITLLHIILDVVVTEDHDQEEDLPMRVASDHRIHLLQRLQYGESPPMIWPP